VTGGIGLAVLSRMKSVNDRLDCYIVGLDRPVSDLELRSRGMAAGMISFAIPAYGVLFKCRARGTRRDLETGALLALLRFVGQSMKGENITKIRVIASSPELVFKLAQGRDQLTPKTSRQKKLENYLRRIDVIGAYVPLYSNRACCSPADMPSLPEGQTSPIPFPGKKLPLSAFGTVRKGVDL